MKLQTRIHVLYSGRVQGVGFRATAGDIARRFPITGWVRNLADGGVELEAQGSSRDLDEYLAAIASAFDGYISDTQRSEIKIRTDEADFEIRR